MKLQTARKEYVCDLCKRPIPKGDRYWNAFDPQTLDTERHHSNCTLYEKPATAKERPCR